MTQENLHRAENYLCGILRTQRSQSKGTGVLDLSETRTLGLEGAGMLGAGRGKDAFISLTKTGPGVCKKAHEGLG